MGTNIIAKATILSIAEQILQKMRFDTELDMYILPEGETFSIEKELAHKAADFLRIKMNRNTLK